MDEKKVREAIELLQRQICTLEEQKDYDEYGQPLYNETLDIVIEQYETAIEALEKQLPKKPVFKQNAYGGKMACPICGASDYRKYCRHCGQELDWSE